MFSPFGLVKFCAKPNSQQNNQFHSDMDFAFRMKDVQAIKGRLYLVSS